MRREPTFGEVRLWDALRGDALGVRFRRQHPIGRYIADFVCLPARLVVETDGESHFDDGRSETDAIRDRWLRSRGWIVLRYDDDDVHDSLDRVIAEIRSVLIERLPERDL